jgi:outer membrane protein OmpA-like peptidoglycan-associated protein
VESHTTDQDGTFTLILAKPKVYQLRFTGLNLKPKVFTIYGEENLESALDLQIPMEKARTVKLPFLINAENSQDSVFTLQFQNLVSGNQFIKQGTIGVPFTLDASIGDPFRFTVSKPGFFDYTDTIENLVQPAIQRVELNRIAPNVVRTLDKIQFSENRYSITSDVANFLDQFAKFIKMNRVAIKMEVHSDPRGNALFLLDLTERRAAAIKDYLINEAKVPERYLKVVGTGAEKPINGCKLDSSCTEEEFKANERVTFEIVELIR